MKIGTVLLNTGVKDNHPYKYSIYTGQSNGKASFIYPYDKGMNNGHYLMSDIGKDKPIQPIGHIDLQTLLKDAIQNVADNQSQT